MTVDAGDKRISERTRAKAPTLTDAQIARMKPDGRDRWVKDGQACLYLRVRPKGRKEFALRVNENGRIRVTSVGVWAEGGIGGLSAKEARLKAASMRLDKPAASDQRTVATALEKFWHGHIEREWKDDRNALVYRRVIEGVLGSRALTDVTKGDVAKLVEGYRVDREGNPRPVAANRLLSFCKLFLNWCAAHDYIDTNPALPLNTKLNGSKEYSRERILTNDEIRALWAWEGPHTNLLRALLLTGCRISELQKATTKHIVGDQLVIPAAHAKNGREHWVYITPTMRSQFAGRAPKLFHFATPTAVQACVRRWQDFTDTAWTPHDLRRTFATFAGDLRVPPHIIRALINHKEDGALPIYMRSDFAAERIAATKAIEAHVLAIVAKAS